MDVPAYRAEHEESEEMEWTVDYDDPSFAPLDPSNREANARPIDWDAPLPMRQRPKRRPASEGEVRRLQFETARRIIFGTRNVWGYTHRGEPTPGKQPRDAWTTGGFVRAHDITYHTPFQLGNATLMITPGLNEREDNPRVPIEQRAVPMPVEVVWMEMPGPIVDKRKDGRPFVYTPTVLGFGTAFMINYQWVCIGYLRADDFIPVIPDFSELLRLEVVYYGDGNDDVRGWEERVQTEEEWFIPDGFNKKGELRGEAIDIPMGEVDYEQVTPLDEGGSEEEELPDQLQTAYTIEATWMQLVPQPNAQHPLQFKAEDVGFAVGVNGSSHDEPDEISEHSGEAGWGDTKWKVGKYRMATLNGNWHLIYTPVLPSRLALSIFHFDVPHEFLRRLGLRDLFQDDPGMLCGFKRTFHEEEEPVAPRREPVYTGWRLDDVARVIYAQSYLMHVLTGPDRRRYENVPRDVAQVVIEDAKETQEPQPWCKIVSTPAIHGALRIELLGSGHVPFVSSGTALRLWTPSLALRAARVLQQEHAQRAMQAFAAHGREGGTVFAHVLRGDDEERLARELAAMQIPLDRFEEFEFMGCHVCLDKPAELQSPKVPGLKVCSEVCYRDYKAKAARIGNWVCSVDRHGRATIREAPVSKPGWKLVYERHGGLAGYNEVYVIHQDGRVDYTDLKHKERGTVQKRPVSDPEDVREWALAQPEALPPPMTDAYHMWVTLYDASGKQVGKRKRIKVPLPFYAGGDGNPDY
jgi:hypothetical protein